MSCITKVTKNGIFEDGTFNNAKINDSTINAPSITGGITLDKVTSDELVTAIEADLTKKIKEVVESEQFKKLAADKGIFTSGVDINGNIVLDKVAIQSLAEQLLESTTDVVDKSLTKFVKDKHAFLMDKGSISGATTIDQHAADSIYKAIEASVKDSAGTKAKEVVDNALKEELSLVLKGTEFKNGLSMDDATKDAIFTRLTKDIQALIDKSFVDDDSDVAKMISEAIKNKFASDLGAFTATGATIKNGNLENASIKGGFSLDETSRQTFADIVTAIVSAKLEVLVKERFDLDIECWANATFDAKNVFAFSVKREVAPEPKGKAKTKTDEAVGVVNEVMDLVFYPVLEEAPTREQYDSDTLPEYATVVTIDLAPAVDTYTKEEIDKLFEDFKIAGYVFAIRRRKENRESGVDHLGVKRLIYRRNGGQDERGEYPADGKYDQDVKSHTYQLVFVPAGLGIPTHDDWDADPKLTKFKAEIVEIEVPHSYTVSEANSLLEEAAEDILNEVDRTIGVSLEPVLKRIEALEQQNKDTEEALASLYECTGCYPDLKGFLTYMDTSGAVKNVPIAGKDKVEIKDAVEILAWGKLDTVVSAILNVGSATLKYVPKRGPSWTSNWSSLLRGSTELNDPNISKWSTSHVKNLSWALADMHKFNQPLAGWDTSNVTRMDYLFCRDTEFDQDISGWNVSNVTNMEKMFWEAASFNQPIGAWDTKSLTNLDTTFNGAKAFDQDISGWDVSNVTNIAQIFSGATSFNKPLNAWNTSKVQKMYNAFEGAEAFNQPLDKWDVSKVTNMGAIFSRAKSFNQPLNNWDTGNVTDMSYMFYEASSFDQPLDNWDVSNVTDMSYMFQAADSFNQDLSQWCVALIPTKPLNFDSGISNWTKPRPVWGTCPRGEIYNNKPYVTWKGTDDKIYETAIPNTGNMTIQDGNVYAKEILSWGTSDQLRGIKISIPGGKLTNVPPSAPKWTTTLMGLFEDQTKFNDPNIVHWDMSHVTETGGWKGNDIHITTPELFGMFQGCTSFNQPIGSWDMSNVTDISGMFYGCSSFNQDINDWNVSNVTDMLSVFMFCEKFNQPLDKWDVSNVRMIGAVGAGMFYGCTAFDQDINDWDVSNVINIIDMFAEATSFNQPLDKWDTSNVTSMRGVFYRADSFNQPLDNWNVSNVTNMQAMFKEALSFNQDISGWNVSNVTNMDSMFMSCSTFNQDLSEWCVALIPSKPISFDSETTKWTLPRPVWGTCPSS